MLIWSLCQELIINNVNVRDNYFENFKELVIVKRRLSTREITNLFSVQPFSFTFFKLYDFLLVTLVAIFIENQIESDSLIHKKINQKLIMKNELADAKFVSPKFFVVIRQPNFGISKIVLQNVIAVSAEILQVCKAPNLQKNFKTQ
ncbi:hypothetical protein BpHYR1_032402, partial [Brachionus plicatilis]